MIWLAIAGAVFLGRWWWAALLLGFSLGGFFDGIVLHQILQWHNMLSSVTPPSAAPATPRRC